MDATNSSPAASVAHRAAQWSNVRSAHQTSSRAGTLASMGRNSRKATPRTNLLRRSFGHSRGASVHSLIVSMIGSCAALRLEAGEPLHTSPAGISEPLSSDDWARSTEPSPIAQGPTSTVLPPAVARSPMVMRPMWSRPLTISELRSWTS